MMTNRALTYRSGPQGRVVTAFSVAIAIHLSAVALASFRHEAQPMDPVPGVLIVEVDPSDPSTPPEVEVFPQILTPALSPQEFIESEQTPEPILKKRAVVPIRTFVPTLSGAAGTRASALFAPRPEYPFEARSRRLIGSGTAVLSVDSETGLVRDVSMAQPVGYPVLDNAAISAFKRWRFKRGTQRVRVPITFTLAGAHF